MTAPPDNGYTAAMACARRAMVAVLGDAAAWREEAQRMAAPALPWPIKGEGEGYPQLLRNLAQYAAESIVLCNLQAAGYVAALPVPLSPVVHKRVREVVRKLDPADPLAQVWLRMTKRAVDAADHELRRAFGGRGRLDGKAKFKQWADLLSVEAGLAAGHGVVEVARAMGCSPETLYQRLRKPAR